jgi:tetratricopeptide (TPR) repeat protein
MALMLKGDATAALAEIEQEKIESWRMIGLPMAYCALGRKADADAALNALIAKYEKDAPYNIAYVYAFCGDADKAFEWLDKAVAYQDRDSRNRNGKSVRQNPLRPALAALPAQDRQGPRPARQDRVQGDAAAMSMPTFIAFAQKIGVMPKAAAKP